jgi:integrase
MSTSTIVPTALHRTERPQPPDAAAQARNADEPQSPVVRKAAVERLLAFLAISHRCPWQLWGPRLGALMGLRTGEIALLEAGDVVRHRDRWIIHVQRGSGTRALAVRHRVVPVPPTLEAAGFIAFVEQQPRGLLFPELAQSKVPGDTLEQCVRQRAKSSPDPSLHGLTFRSLRQAYVDVLDEQSGSMFATAVLVGDVVSDHLEAVRRLFDEWRDPARLTAFVDQAAFPELFGPTTPRPRRTVWKGQRDIALTKD